MANFIVLVGTIKRPWNTGLKYFIEQNSREKVLCFIDSANAGKKVGDTPVIALDEIDTFLNKAGFKKEKIEFLFLFPFNTEGRRKIFEIIKKKIGENFKFKNYSEVYEKFKAYFSSLKGRENFIWLGKYDIERAKDVIDKLKDDKSKEIAKTWIQFRETFNPKYLDIYISPKQYLPDDVPILQNLPDKFTLLDIGAYDGDTLEFFFKETRKVNKKIETYIAFEPATKYFKELTKRVENLKKEGFNARTFLFKQACGDKFSQSILTNLDSYPVIVDTSKKVIKKKILKEEFIEIVPPDEVVKNQKIDIIKMDIEGFEEKCLNGLRNLIQIYKPILEISIYHRPEDLYEIPEFIRTLNPDYDLYIRTHHSWYIDTVLYAIPK